MPISFCTEIVAANTGDPIRGATLALGQESNVSDEHGKVKLQLLQKPRNDEVLQVSHKDYVRKFVRFDNLSARTEIRLDPKYRVFVADFSPRDDSLNSMIIPTAEDQLAKCREIESVSDTKRNELVEKLFQYQEERALYDKGTLSRVGNFRGATHGVFGTINREGGLITLNCVIVDLLTAMQAANASVRLTRDDLGNCGSKQLMDQLLAELSQVEILSPVDGTKVAPSIHVSGYGLFLPVSWTLWISVMPLNSSRHYPQMRLTVESDGFWTAPGVRIGDEQPNASDPRFAIYAVLTDPSATERMEQYHEAIKASSDANKGLELASWGTDHCKILDRIVVTPRDK